MRWRSVAGDTHPLAIPLLGAVSACAFGSLIGWWALVARLCTGRSRLPFSMVPSSRLSSVSAELSGYGQIARHTWALVRTVALAIHKT